MKWEKTWAQSGVVFFSFAMVEADLEVRVWIRWFGFTGSVMVVFDVADAAGIEVLNGVSWIPSSGVPTWLWDTVCIPSLILS